MYPQKPPTKIRRRSSKKPLLLILLAILVLGGAFALHGARSKATVMPTPTTPKKVTAKTNSDTIKIIATGDMLPHDAINKNAKTSNGYDYSQFFTKVKPYLSGADISYCNQESPSASSFGVSGYPTFNAPLAFPSTLSGLGCNVINLANNHADDKGQTGINETIQAWKALNPLAIAGTNASADEQSAVHYFTVKGVKFAYLGYSECSNDKSVSNYGLNQLSNAALVHSQVAEARKNADFVMAGLHSCTEGTRTPDSAINTWSQYMADHGVDAVIGTGPHWLQSVNRLPKAGGGTTVVWYSLGNFLSAQTDIGGLIGGIAVMNVSVSSKQITSIGFLPTYMHYEWTAQQKASQDLLARHDFMLYPLDQSVNALKNSQDNTTVEAQTKLVTDLMNQNTGVPILTSKNYANFK